MFFLSSFFFLFFFLSFCLSVCLSTVLYIFSCMFIYILYSSAMCIFKRQKSECLYVSVCVRVFVMINVKYPIARWCWTRPIHQQWKDQWAESWRSTLSGASAPQWTHTVTHRHYTHIDSLRPRLCNPLSYIRSTGSCLVLFAAWVPHEQWCLTLKIRLV